MSSNQRPQIVAVPLLALLVVSYLVQGLVRKPVWRANVAWIVRSWWHPADREARWQQASGVEVDPWDKVIHGHNGAEGSGPQSHVPSSMGR